MFKDIQDIIKQSTFTTLDGKFIYVKVNSISDINKHFMVSRDNDEITVVTRVENLKDLDLIERNKDDYTLIALNVSVPFYSVGFLATVSEAIAKEGMNVLIVSTYSKDYIMVKEELKDKAKDTLLSLGLNEK